MKSRDSSIFVVLGVSIIMAYSCLFWTQMTSLIDFSIRDTENKMVIGEQVARQSSVNHSNPLIVNLTMEQVSKENLLAIINASEKIKGFFAKRGVEVSVGSLATISDYKGEEISNYLTVSGILSLGFNPQKWYEDNKNRLPLKNSFLGETEGKYYTNLIIFPKQDESEVLVAKTWLLCKAGWDDYQFGWWQHYSKWNLQNLYRYFTLNFNPKVELSSDFNKFELKNKEDSGKVIVNSDIGVSINANGWSFFRLVIDAMARSSAYQSLGLAFLALTVFSILASLGTWKKVGVSLAVIAQAFIWAKGTVGVTQKFIDWVNANNVHQLNWLANSLLQHSYEDVFTIEAYFAVMVSGISFPWHYLRKFNRVRQRQPELSYWEAWKVAKKKVRITKLICGIAVFDFLLGLSVANLYGARAMWTVGLVSAVGVASAWILTHFFMPVAYYYIGGKNDSLTEKQSKFSKKAERFVRGQVRAIIAGWVIKKYSAVISLAVFLLVVISSTLLIPVYLKTDNNLEKFLQNSPSERIYIEMNKAGGSGSTMFRPLIEADLLDPQTLDDIRQYLEMISNHSRMIQSPLYYFIEILEEDYAYKQGQSIFELLMNEADGQADEARLIAEDIWQSILDEDTAKVIKNFLPADETFSYMEVMVTSAESSTVQLTKLRDDFLMDPKKSFFRLQIWMSGKISQYLEIDRIISSGQQFWQVLSQLVIILFCALWSRRQTTTLEIIRWQVSSTGYGFSVATPFIWATAILYILLMLLGLPQDIATASIGTMAVAIAIDFPLFIMDFFQKTLAKSNALHKDVFAEVMESREVIDAIVDVIFDYFGNAILFSFMMFTSVEAIWRCGILEEWVLLNCIFATIFLVLPMLRWTIQEKQEEGSVPRMLRIANSRLNNTNPLFVK